MVGMSLEEAITLLRSASRVHLEAEVLPLNQANGRILARDYKAPISNPPFDRSPP